MLGGVDFGHGGLGEGNVAAEFTAHEGHGVGGTTTSADGKELVVFPSCLDEAVAACIIKRAIVALKGMFGGDLVFGVQTEVAEGVVEISVAVEICRGDTRPPPGEVGEARIGFGFGNGRFGGTGCPDELARAPGILAPYFGAS